MIGGIVYILGTLVTLACGVLLMRGYVRGRQKLLLWSSLCFFGLSLANIFVFFDLVLFPNINFYPARLITAAIAMLLLVFGLIWEDN
jgi:hypothetical protein